MMIVPACRNGTTTQPTQRVLVIDNEQEVHQLIREYLPSRFTVCSAYDGTEGCTMYRELSHAGKTPDVVVMDLNLSETRSHEGMIRQMQGKEMDGVAATKTILKYDPEATIVGFSAFADMEWGERLKQAGAQRVFGRNIGFESFAEQIEEIISRQ